MGWVFKGLVLVAGLVSLTLGFWPLWIPCFGYLGYSLWAVTRRRTVLVRDETKRGRASGMGNKAFKKRYVAACAFFALAAIAVAGGGTFAPWVFLSAGLMAVASGVLGRGPSFSEVRVVPNSILLKNRWLPFSWLSLIEVKFATQNIARSLASVGSEMILTVTNENVSVYLPIRVRAGSVASAESRVSEKLAPIARMLSSRGSYALPLESEAAAERMDWSLKSVGIALEHGRDGVASLNSTPFDALVLLPSGHLLESAAAYVIARTARRGRYRVPGRGKRLENQPLLWEALQKLAEERSPKGADAMTGFLSSISATRGESLGDRLEGGGQTESGKVVIGSLGGAQVELTRPQLRAIVRAYG